MTAIDSMQKFITERVAKGFITPRPFNGYQVEVEWYLGDVPLCIPDEVVGEWRLVRARRQDKLWQILYSYYRPLIMYCVMLHLEEGPVEVPGSRSPREDTALAIAHNLNTTILVAGKCEAPFQVHQLENSDE
jgi:hypothetical protein